MAKAMRLGALSLIVLLFMGCSQNVEIKSDETTSSTMRETESVSDSRAQTCERLWSTDATGIASEAVDFVKSLESSDSIDIVPSDLKAQVEELHGISQDAETDFRPHIESIIIPLTESLRASDNGGKMTYNPSEFKEAAQFLFGECFPEVPVDAGGQQADPTGTQCEADFARAAAVPLSRTNDQEVDATLYSCASVDEWKRALRKYPEVLGVPDPTSMEIDLSLEVACSNTRGNPPIC